MKSYWDVDERDRAKLTEDDVKSYLAVELMQAGVAKPRGPKIVEAIEPSEQLGKESWYEVVGEGYSAESVGLFRTMDQAEKFIELCPLKSDFDYRTGTKYKYAVAHTNLSVRPVELYRQADIVALKPQLEGYKEACDSNDREQSRYNDECEKARKATKLIWEDWHDQTLRESEASHMISVLEEYAQLCDGDDAKAEIFLRKAKGDDVVDSAFEWLGRESRIEQSVGA